jgi:hypothetical protein
MATLLLPGILTFLQTQSRWILFNSRNNFEYPPVTKNIYIKHDNNQIFQNSNLAI